MLARLGCNQRRFTLNGDGSGGKVRETRGSVLDWNLAVTYPGWERRVGESFAEQSLLHHLFKVRRREVRRGRVIERLLPAFPRYVFVAAQQAWDRVLGTKGIRGFILDVDKPATVPARVLDTLTARCEVDDVFVEHHPEPVRFHCGEKLLIIGDSALSGMAATYQHTTHDGERACVLIDWMGRSAVTELDERDLRKLSERRPMRKKYRHRRSYKLAA